MDLWRTAGVHPFNEGVGHASGKWIAPLDQDDEWTEDHLEILLATATASRAELVSGVCATQVGHEGQTYFGQWPAREGEFAFLGAIYHAGIADFMLYDLNSYLSAEPADWNLARRMLDVVGSRCHRTAARRERVGAPLVRRQAPGR